MCGGRALVFGGLSGVVSLNEVHAFDGSSWTQLPNAPWAPRWTPAVSAVNGSISIMTGGITYTNGVTVPFNDVWAASCSSVGADPQWTMLTAAAPWSARYEHASVVWRDDLVLMGGAPHVPASADAWSMSLRTHEWTARPLLPWASRLVFAMGVMHDRLFVSGGYISDYRNDCWMLTDWSASWLRLADAAYVPRYGMASLVLNDAFWLLAGGVDSNNVPSSIPLYAFNDTVWAAQSQPAWPPRYGASLLPFDASTLLILGGRTSNLVNDVWSAQYSAGGNPSPALISSSSGAIEPVPPPSSTGAVGPFPPPSPSALSLSAWSLSAPASWSPRLGFRALMCGGRALVFGGSASMYLNDVHAFNGHSWTQLAYAPWSPRMAFAASAVNATTMILTGGQWPLMQDVWMGTCESASADPQWRRLTLAAPWPARYNHVSVVWRSELLILGGLSTGYLHSVYSMDLQSQQWTPRLPLPGALYDIAVGVMADALFVSDSSGASSRVWMLADWSAQWIQLADASYSPRRSLASLVVAELFWLLAGGLGSSGAPSSIPLYAFNGVTWIAQAAPQWPLRSAAKMLQFNASSVMILGGINAAHATLNDCWTTQFSSQSVPISDPSSSSSGAIGPTPPGAYSSTAAVEPVPSFSSTGDVGPVLPSSSAGPMPPGPAVASSSSTGAVGPLPPAPASPFSLSPWSLSAPTSWSVRSGFAPAMCGSRALVFGGLSTVWLNDVHAFDGHSWSALAVLAPWSARSSFAATAVNPTTVIMTGGRNVNEDSDWGSYFNDVWTATCASASADPQWTLLTANAPWPVRYGHQTVVWRNELVLVGGVMGGYAPDDAWSMSLRTHEWTQRSELPWLRRSLFALGVISDRLYVSGGLAGMYRNDCWMLTEWAAMWVQLPDAPYSPRGTMGSQVLNGAFWLLAGGVSSVGIAPIPLYSFDGASWSAEAPPQWGLRYAAQLLQWNDSTVLMLGGETETEGRNDVWSATFTGSEPRPDDGSSTGAIGPPAPPTPTGWALSSWTLQSDAASWSPRMSFGAVMCRGTLLVLGGFTAGSIGFPSAPSNEVHASNGGNWTQLANAAWNPRGDFAATPVSWGSDDDQFVLTGGWDPSSPPAAMGNQVIVGTCFSPTEVAWSVLNAAPPFLPRIDHAAVQWRGELVLMGGRLPLAVGLTARNDVFTLTPAGWQQRATAPWHARYAFAAAVLSDQLFVSGGFAAQGALNDCWMLSGWTAGWTPLVASSSYSPRGYTASAALGGAFWLMGGGVGTLGGPISSLYMFDGSATGGWDVLDAPSWPVRASAQMLQVDESTVMVIGGFSASGLMNDVWVATFSGSGPEVPPLSLPAFVASAADSVSFGPRTGAGAVMCGGRAFIIGGQSTSLLNEVHAFDGVEWRQLSNAPWSPRAGFGLVAVDSTTIALTGGSNTIDMWQASCASGSDLQWTQLSAPPSAEAGSGHRTLMWKDRLVMLGGCIAPACEDRPQSWIPGTNDWTSQPVAPWTRRTDFAAVVLRNQLFFFGGLDANGAPLNDVWALSDWTLPWQQLSPAPWRAGPISVTIVNASHCLVNAQGWSADALGPVAASGVSLGASSELNSFDGADWSPQARPGWGNWRQSSLLQFNADILLFIGGMDEQGNARNEVWVAGSGGGASPATGGDEPSPSGFRLSSPGGIALISLVVLVLIGALVSAIVCFRRRRLTAYRPAANASATKVDLAVRMQSIHDDLAHLNIAQHRGQQPASDEMHV